jgi:hypothetical protein
MNISRAPDDRFRKQPVSDGVPAEAADQPLGGFAAGRAGESAAVDPTPAVRIDQVVRRSRTPPKMP